MHSKESVEIWNSFTDLEEKKRAPAFFLSLDKKTKQAVSQLKSAEISAENGLQKIIEKTDEVYVSDRNTRAYGAFQKFYECEREEWETLEDFNVKFEGKYDAMDEYDMGLLDSSYNRFS